MSLQGPEYDLVDTTADQVYKGYDGDYLNVASVADLPSARVEASLSDAKPGERFQFVRVGYFVKDTKYENTFNRIVGLKDSYKV